jgi:hypothetical protein
MAIHASTGGSEAGFAEFDAWSKGWKGDAKGARYNADATRVAWDGLEPDRIGFGFLAKLAYERNPDWRDTIQYPEAEPAAGGGGSGGNGADGAPHVAAAPEPKPDGTPYTINDTLEVFERWLLLKDRTPVYAVLGTVSANMLPGDPVWLGLIAPPSSAKTEILNSVSRLRFVAPAATLTLPGLLSGTPKRQYGTGAKGGLLRQIGAFGILMMKDFGSILAMRPDSRNEFLGALREIFDGSWIRHLGSEGGRTLEWKGKVGLIFGATPVIDSYYTVIGTMGDRFLFNRMTPDPNQLKRALLHKGGATQRMRQELAEAVERLFAEPRREPRPLSDEEFDRLNNIVSLAVRLRGGVERDRVKRDLEVIYGAEGTARLGLTLEGLLAGLDALGVDRTVAFKVIETVAMDSVPPLRRRAYEWLEGRGQAKTSSIAAAVGLPTTTVRRALEELAAYDLVARHHASRQGESDAWSRT